MRTLVINLEVQQTIDAAVVAARVRPVLWEKVKKIAESINQYTDEIPLKDRPSDFEATLASQSVLIPHGFRAAISFEDQPAGLVRHLSISVDSKTGGMPHPRAAMEIAKAFGFSGIENLESFDRIWTEEYEPGKWALNLLQLDRVREAPTEARQ
jgi:hypothetical protein